MSEKHPISIITIDNNDLETKESFNEYMIIRHYHHNNSTKKKVLEFIIKSDGIYILKNRAAYGQFYLEIEEAKKRFSIIKVSSQIFDARQFRRGSTYKALLSNRPEAENYNNMITIYYSLPHT